MKSRLSTELTTEIQSLLDRFLSAWNAKDLDQFIPLFTEDAEFTDVVDQTALGREAIRKQHQFPFKVVLREASLELNNIFMRSVLPNLVLVTANWLVQNSCAPDGKTLPNRNGVIQFIFIENETNNWKIKLVHNSDFALPYKIRDKYIQ